MVLRRPVETRIKARAGGPSPAPNQNHERFPYPEGMELLALVLTPIVALLSILAWRRREPAREEEDLTPTLEWRRQDWRETLD